MKNKKEIEIMSKKIAKIKNIEAIYLFGSHATKKNNSFSDIDICIIGDLTEDEAYRVLDYSNDKIDICFFNKLPVYIKFRVLKEGKRLFVRDIEKLNIIRFRTLGEYLDFKPSLNKFCMETLKCTI
jgi:hypothetical protein